MKLITWYYFLGTITINKRREFTKNDINKNKKIHEEVLNDTWRVYPNVVKNTLTNVNWRGPDIRNIRVEQLQLRLHPKKSSLFNFLSRSSFVQRFINSRRAENRVIARISLVWDPFPLLLPFLLP